MQGSPFRELNQKLNGRQMSKKIAHISLDFRPTGSVSGAVETIPHGCEHARNHIKAHLKEMRDRLDRAAGIAKAAETCAEVENIQKAVEIALDVEQLIYEVVTFLNAASLMHRIWKS